MAETAFQIQYRQEAIKGFEQCISLVRQSVTTEAVIKGNQATFLVADSGGAETVTRGSNGRIPARSDNLSQPVAQLVEQHDVVEKSGFNIFSSQGDQRAIMQWTSASVINRRIDNEIISELSNGTLDTGAPKTGSLRLSIRAKTILQNNDVPSDGNIWALITPAYEGYLMETKEFASAEYVLRKPFEGDSPDYTGMQGFHRWMNVNWIVHPNLPGAGTANEKCFMYHRSAIGHAMNSAGLQFEMDWDKRHDLSWVRSSAYMGPKLLQNSGVVVINHDGSEFAPE